MKCQVCWTYDGHHEDCELNNLQAENKRLRKSLKDAIERMDRARKVLTKGEPTLAHNWGILDVSSLRKALKGDESND